MDGETKKYLFPADGRNVEAVKEAFSLLLKLCRESEASINATLLIPVKDTFKRSVPVEALGEKLAEALLKQERLKLPEGKSLILKTERTFHESWTSDVILALYPTPKMLNQIDNAKKSPAVIVVPWRMKDIEEWKRTWNPIIPRVPRTTCCPGPKDKRE